MPLVEYLYRLTGPWMIAQPSDTDTETSGVRSKLHSGHVQKRVLCWNLALGKERRRKLLLNGHQERERGTGAARAVENSNGSCRSQLPNYGHLTTELLKCYYKHNNNTLFKGSCIQFVILDKFSNFLNKTLAC